MSRFRSLPLIWLVALGAAVLGFSLVLAGAALADRTPKGGGAWGEAATRGYQSREQ